MSDKKNNHIGSSVESLFEELGELKEVRQMVEEKSKYRIFYILKYKLWLIFTKIKTIFIR